MGKTEPTLRAFHWKGVNNQGKKVSGQTLAITEMEARASLKQQHIQVRKIKRRSLSTWTRLTQRINSKDITVLTRQLATMLSTGIPIVHAIKLIADNQSKAEMKSVLTQISKGLEAGTPISRVMQVTSRHFDSFYVDMVATGENSGNLAGVFERLADYREKQEMLRSKVVKALIYPVMILLVSLGVTYLMLTTVVPEFESMFRGFNASLPWFTVQVLNLSRWFQENGFLVVNLIIISTLGLKVARQRSFAIRLSTSRLALLFLLSDR
ncbi:type IV fimbrial assembly protein PilC [Vibrio variabilis]|uniref:Type IV fimbrial assembly protein PilC n=1 Tax=Vibrio variabilis TaxID=990271 RepID=A0ABQ0J579_9VIBR|nr:type IV fimbrial assembly protein PilC [Vibrio variabilis]